MNKAWKFKMILFVIAGILAMAAIVMWLWNWLVPVLFSGPEINFLQSLGLMLLTRILFRGIHGNKFKNGIYCGPWSGWKDRYEKMTPEQKEKMRELWKKRCGGWDCDDDATMR